MDQQPEHKTLRLTPHKQKDFDKVTNHPLWVVVMLVVLIALPLYNNRVAIIAFLGLSL